MKESIWQKRIPTILGIFVITIGIAVTSFLAQQGIITIGRASPANTPQDVRITNISDSSFTVSFKTADSVPGTISYSTDKSLALTAMDDRDQDNHSITSYRIHHITVHNLRPSTAYFFAVISGAGTFLNNGLPFDVKTAPTINGATIQQYTLTGTAITNDGQTPSEAMIYATTDGAQTFSALIKAGGSYSLPLSSMRTADFVSYAPISDTSTLQLLAVGSDGQSNIKVLTKQIKPVPTIILSKDYDFTVGTLPLASTPASSSAQSSFPSLSTGPTTSKEPQILTPKKDDQLSDQQPLFKGVASPSADVKIVIHSDAAIQAQTTADNSGFWTFRPSQPLSAGPHTISITTKDQLGILHTITQSFTVYASGTQVAQTATPSATPIPAKLTPTPTPTAIPIQTTPTLIPTPTTVILLPTATPIPIGTQTKGGTTMPPPGNSVLPIGITAAITTIAGVLLFLVSRGTISL